MFVPWIMFYAHNSTHLNRLFSIARRRCVKPYKNVFPHISIIITSPPIGGGRGIVMPMSVCLFVCLCVCLFVCLSVFSQNFKV